MPATARPSVIDQAVSSGLPDPPDLAGGFDLNLLRVLDALLLTGGVSSAGRRLGLSQSATSGALARLREQLRDPLLVRRGNAMVPTPLAEQLRPRVAAILDEIDAALGVARGFDPATTHRSFRIGATDYTAQVLLPPLVAHLRRVAPHALVEVLPIDLRDTSPLATRETDLLLADDWTVRDERGAQHLYDEHFLCVARADHPALPPQVDLAAYTRVDHALIAPRGLTAGVVDAALAEHGLTRRVAVTVPYFLAATSLVAGTDLVITLPARLAEAVRHDPALRVFEPPLPVPGFAVVSVAHPRSARDAPVAWLQRQVVEVLRG